MFVLHCDREEIMLATALHEPPVGFNTRTGFDLNRIVEDQVSSYNHDDLDLMHLMFCMLEKVDPVHIIVSGEEYMYM